MADNISITPGSGAQIRTNQGSSSGAHMQIIKIAESAAGSETFIPATAANGVTVDVTRVQGVVVVNNPTAANMKVDASGATVPVSSPSPLSVAAAVGSPVFVRLSDGTNPIATLPVSIAATVGISGNVGVTGNPGVSQSGVWNVATVTTITNPVTVTGTVALSGTSPVSGTVTANQGTAAVIGNAWVTKITDGSNAAGLTLVSGNYALKVDVVKQTGGGVSQQDKTTFTEGTTFCEPVAGVYNETISSDPTEDQAAALRITAKRGLHVNIRKSDGTELGIAATPVRTDPTGTTTQPVSGTVTANQGGAPWSTNPTQINGHAISEAANGTQKVGISDAAGATFSQANALPVQNGPSVSAGQTPWRTALLTTAGQTAVALHTPAAGKTSYIEGFIIAVSTTGVVKIFDNTDAAANYLFFGRVGNSADGAADFNQPIVVTPSRPMPLSAINNVLRYTTVSAIAWITIWGYDA